MSHFAVMVAIPPVGDPKSLVSELLDPFNENGEWFGDGTRWDWWVVGGRYERLFPWTIVRVGDIDLAQIRSHARASAEAAYDEAMAQYPDRADLLSICYGINEGESRADYADRRSRQSVSAYAFVRDRNGRTEWHERERMGWFGVPSATECERKESSCKRCVYRNEDRESVIVTYGESDREPWSEKFYGRFIAPLPDDMRLVVVDCHV